MPNSNSSNYETEREVFTHGYLRQAAEQAFELASTIEEGSFHQYMTSIVFSAFTLEAYCNYLGSKSIGFWEAIEDKVAPLGKLEVLYDHFKLDFDKSKRPVQTIGEILKYRNRMAHGRTENLQDSGIVTSMAIKPGQTLVETDWEKFTTEKNAERALEDVMSIAKELHRAANLGDEPFAILGSGMTTYS